MTILHAILLAVVEGVTEFLPVSSTGHLMLTAKLLGLAQSDFVKTFEIIIQLGAILSIVFLYGRKLLINKNIFIHVFTAFITTAIFGFLLYPFIKQVLLDNTNIVVTALFLGGIALILLEKHYSPKQGIIASLTIKQSITIGLVQCLSFIPGVSRAAATIFGGLFLGLSRKEAVEFSFLLAIPTMAAATGLDLIKNADTFHTAEIWLIITGLVASFLTAFTVVKWFTKYITSHSFISFGVYRIVISAIYFFSVLR